MSLLMIMLASTKNSHVSDSSFCRHYSRGWIFVIIIHEAGFLSTASSDSQAGFSVQDAEQQLKAMLFGGTQGASSQPATGARSATLHGNVPSLPVFCHRGISHCHGNHHIGFRVFLLTDA